MIVYLLAIASPTHAVPASLYYSGWAGQSQDAVTIAEVMTNPFLAITIVTKTSITELKLEVGVAPGAAPYSSPITPILGLTLAVSTISTPTTSVIIRPLPVSILPTVWKTRESTRVMDRIPGASQPAMILGATPHTSLN